MRAPFIYLICFAFSLGCSEQHEQPELTGAWNSITYPANYYLFHGDGIMEIHTLGAGQIINEKWFTYDHNREIGALDVRDRNGLYFQGSVVFIGIDTVTLEQDGGLKIVLARW